MIDAFKELMTFDWGSIVLMALLLLTLTVGVVQAGSYLCERFGIETKKTLKEKKRDEEIKKLKDDVLALQQSADKFNQDRINDRAQSFQIQDHWTDMITKITDKQTEIVQSISDLAEQNRKYELADIRETLLQAYRYYTSPIENPTMAWSSMERHAFMEQYQNYIDRKGNSYIKDVVYPAMQKLTEVPMNDHEALSELMESRVRCKG